MTCTSRESFTNIDITALPVTPADVVRAALDEVQLPPIDMRCGRSKEQVVKAVVCCADCKKKFCHQHAEVGLLNTQR